MRHRLPAVALLFTHAAAAGVIVGTNPVTLWGTDLSVTTWNVAPDVGPDAFFSPEGATFHQGVLYLSADLGLQSFGRLAAYTPGPDADLSTPTVIQMGRGSNNQFWGPEGITVNTSAVGFGATDGLSLRLVSVEASDERAAVINLDQPGVPVTDTTSIPEPDDIAFVSAAWGFAFIEDLGQGQGQLRRLDINLVDTGETWPLPPGVEGVAVISADFAQRLTGVRPVADIALLLAAESRDDDNLPSRLLVTDLQANPIAPTMTFTIGLDVSIEAVAVDESTGWVYIADGVSRRVHTFRVPPAACPADINADGVLNFFDLSAYLSLFNAQNPAADLDQNAQFNFFDVSIYLTRYNAGCS
jgi:hypothetical protein